MKCEQNVVKFAGKCVEKWNLYIKYFDKIKCYADRPYLVFSELKPETHTIFFFYFFLPKVLSLAEVLILPSKVSFLSPAIQKRWKNRYCYQKTSLRFDSNGFFFFQLHQLTVFWDFFKEICSSILFSTPEQNSNHILGYFSKVKYEWNAHVYNYLLHLTVGILSYCLGCIPMHSVTVKTGYFRIMLSTESLDKALMATR